MPRPAEVARSLVLASDRSGAFLNVTAGELLDQMSHFLVSAAGGP